MTTQFALLTLPDGNQIEGDSRSEIVDQIIPGHGDIPETEDGIATALALRENYLSHVAQRAQATVMAALTDTAPDAISTLSEDALTAIYHDRSTDTIELGVWDSDIPLFLMASSYVPYTQVPRPAGTAVVFLDPLNEATFLDSLQVAGFAELYERPDTSDLS